MGETGATSTEGKGVPCDPILEPFGLPPMLSWTKIPRPFDRLKDLPRLPPQFVELVETNPDVTSAFASLPEPFDKLRVRPVEFGP